jgi:hypothetical protein
MVTNAQQLRLGDLSAGRAGRDAALNTLETARSDWLLRARHEAIMHCLQYGRVTADDVRQRCPVPEGWDARVVGAVFRDKRFRQVGVTQTTRAASHCRPIAVFELRQRIGVV